MRVVPVTLSNSMYVAFWISEVDSNHLESIIEENDSPCHITYLEAYRYIPAIITKSRKKSRDGIRYIGEFRVNVAHVVMMGVVQDYEILE